MVERGSRKDCVRVGGGGGEGKQRGLCECVCKYMKKYVNVFHDSYLFFFMYLLS